METSAEDKLIGATIAGKFAIESRVGEGAMAVVYRARHLALDKPIALKVMHRMLATDAMFAARFHREAQMASRLEHPSSIRILDFGEDPTGLLYIAMELVEGRDLHDVLCAEWPLGDKRVVHILGQVLSALAVAHDLGIVHRDLKPENIMVVRGADDDGAVVDLIKVCDFGIAKMAEPRSDPASSRGKPIATAAGFMVGTPEYMAPEQARGEALDARADLYAVGVILYRLLTGTLPFQAETALGVAVKHIYEEPAAPSVRAFGVSPALEAICLKALRKDPQERYQTARQMRAELRALRGKDDGSVTSEPPPSSLRASVTEAAVTLAAPSVPVSAPVPSVPSVPSVPAASPTLRAPASLGAPAVEALSLTQPAPLRLANRAALGVGAALLLGLGLLWMSRGSVVGSPGVLPSATQVAIVNDGVSALPVEPSAAPVTAPERSAEPAPSAAPTPSLTARALVALVALVERDAGAPIAAPGAPTIAALEPPPAPAPSVTPTAAPEVPTAAPAITAAPTAAPAIDVEAARVIMGGVSTTAGVPASSVRGVLGHVSFTRCYQDALRAVGSGAASASGSALLHLTIDDTGRVTSASASGMGFLPGARACIEGAVRGLRIPNVDTGDATADVSLSFSLH